MWVVQTEDQIIKDVPYRDLWKIIEDDAYLKISSVHLL